MNNTKTPTKRRGRPPKNSTKALGRPKDPKGAMKEYRDRMLSSPQSRKVLDSIFKAALDDDHKNQAAAWNIIIDRIAPKRLFENEVDGGAGGSNAIKVTITTAGGSVNIGEHEEPKDISDAEYTEVTNE